MTVEEQQQQGSIESFSDFGLDERLVRVLTKQGITTPTLIQEKAIPLALSGKDILAKARTGSGKTLAYLLPSLHQLLQRHSLSSLGGINVLILVPTKELSRQVTLCAKELLEFCDLNVLNLSTDDLAQVHKRSLVELEPAILVSTPAKLCSFLEDLDLRASLQTLIIDEADLVLSFGYADDLDRITAHLPSILQTYLMSATITTEIDQLKALILHNPVVLRLEDGADQGDNSSLQQYSISVPKQEDKFLLVYVALKLRLLTGKILIFVNDVDKSFRLKLFLEQFQIRACVLNAELPLSSRQHMVEEFNRGVYDTLIASDVKTTVGSSSDFSVARGVDFKRVDVVLNFDLPDTPSAYVHRVGRTARGGAKGTALSLICAQDGVDGERLCLIQQDQLKRYYGDLPESMLVDKSPLITPYPFDLTRLEGFRYRCSDALRSVTRAAVKEARAADLKSELLNSARLKAFLEDRPRDAEALLQRHDRLSCPKRIKPHLKHVPDYLLGRVGAASSLHTLPQAPLQPSNRSLKRVAGVIPQSVVSGSKNRKRRSNKK